MQRHPHRFQRATSSIAAIVAFFGLVPLALTRTARARFDSSNPLTDIAAPWRWNPSDVVDALSGPLRDGVVVNLLIRSSLTVIWLALVVIALTTVAETVHMVRHRGMPSPSVRGLGWAQGIARWLAVGLVALLPLNSFSSSAAAIDQPLGLAAPAQQSADSAIFGLPATGSERLGRDSTPMSFGDDHRSPSSRPAPRSPSPDDPPGVDASDTVHIHTVLRGESIFAISQTYANNDETETNRIADAIVDLNLNALMNDGQRFVNPALVQPGWNLSLPPGVGSQPASGVDAIESDPRTIDDDPTPARGIPRVDPGALHVVERGDTLSGIADEHLGDPDAWPDLWEQNAGRDMGAGRSFDDPNLILPGWDIRVTSDASDAGAGAGEPNSEPANTAGPPPETRFPTAQPDDVATITTSTVPPITAPPIAAPPVTSPSTTVATPSPDASTTASTPPPTTSLPPAPAGGNQPGEVGQGDSAPTAPVPLRLEHAALLAAGVLTLVGVRRRRALRAALPHARVPTPSPEVVATERRLRTIDAGERGARVDIAARAAAHHIAETGVQIGIVRAAPDGELTIHFTGSTRLGAPWTGSDSTWVLPASVPIEMLGDDARRAGQPCLALVTIGIDSDGRDVLLDLEAAGLTTIEATPDQGDEIVRAIGSGLATSLSSEVVHLVVADLGTAMLFDHPNTRRLGNAVDALSAAAQLVGSTLAHERSAFDLRTRRTGGEMWEPAVILLGHADDTTTALSGLPAPGHGIAVVASSDPESLSAGRAIAPGHHRSGAVLRAHADRWELIAFGEQLDIEPIGISVTDVAEIAAVLADASAPVESNRTGPNALESPATAASALGTAAHGSVLDPDLEPEPSRVRSDTTSLEVLPHDLVVSLLGGVTITDRAGNAGTFERSKTVELIAWLATHRERATRGAARTALWELDVRDATFANVVSEARRALARLTPPPDGDEWLARTLNESLPLHERVVTDIDLIRQRVAHAQLAPPAHAISVLRPAVEMIRDLPFAGTSYLWPDADGLTSNFVLLAITAAGELAAHALSVGDTELVFWATGQGLIVLPGHEELIGLRMRAHARAGDLAGVRQEWESYERVINSDSWSDGEPAPKLLALRRELLTAPS